jgi:hypothetical protein
MTNVFNSKWAAVSVGLVMSLAFGCAGEGDTAETMSSEVEVSSVEQSVSNVPGTCPGASGSNCSGLPNGFCTNSTTTPGWVSCSVTIGAQMHDTCCGFYPGGVSCGGSTKQYCTPPANSKYVGSTYQCCQAEWDHAVGDMAAGRYWSWGFNESVVAPAGYRMATTAVLGGQVTAYPTSNSIYPKPGSIIWKVDAQLGWCKNGIRSQGLTDAVCN